MSFRKICILILFDLFINNFAIGQTGAVSTHSLRIFKNNKEQAFKKCELSVLVDSIAIVSVRAGEAYTFPIIDTTKEIRLWIKTDRKTFIAGPYKASWLNSGTAMIFGELTNIGNLISVAGYNGMTKNEENWDIYSKRFFIVNRAYTITIDNFRKIKELQFFILNPNGQGDPGSYSLTQKVIRSIK